MSIKLPFLRLSQGSHLAADISVGHIGAQLVPGTLKRIAVTTRACRSKAETIAALKAPDFLRAQI